LTALFGIPAPLTKEQIASETGLHWTLNHVNMFAGGRAGEEFLLIDGERTELSFSLSGQVSSHWYATAKLPLVLHDGGFLDHTIQQWHDWFVLPNGDRDEVDQNQVAIEYRGPEGQSFSLLSASHGVGDLSLELIRPLTCRECLPVRISPELAPLARFGLKLPTGKTADLTGSGAADVFAELNSGYVEMGDRWTVRASIGVVYAGDSQLFSNQRNFATYGFLGANYRRSSTMNLIAQLDWHTALFDSDLKELGDGSVRLTVGFAVRVLNRRIIEIALQEDLTPDTPPDVGFFIRYRRQH